MSPVIATAKSLKTSTRKMGIVAALVRGRSVKEGIIILEHTPRAAAKELYQVVKSAQANAENNHKLSADKLVINQVLVGSAGMVKRYRAGARGMIRPIRHRLSRVTVVLDEAQTTDVKTEAKKAKKPVKVAK